MAYPKPSFFHEAREIVSPEVIPAFAEHGQGIASERNPLGGGPFTRITRYASWYENGEFVANVDGHLPDGAEHTVGGRTYRLTLVERPAFRPRLALVAEAGERVRNYGASPQ